jgi:DNA (cytosine-5)-methyltransferase 1
MKKKIKVGSDFSGVGAFDQALMRLGIDYETEFACDMDKYARTTYIHNYGEPKYYPQNVYNREIPSESLDIYMTSPPCQAFSLAGKRLGKDDKRGILFFNSHEFITKNKPRFFIFENVKGLLSDDGGKTFQEWVNLLGGKSVNGLPILFAYEDSVPYHIYWKVLNAKEHGVPQNRERVFIIGIRDDQDNNFRFPAEEHLTKRLKDVLENDVAEKYYLSEKMLELLTFEKKGSVEIANINKGGQKGSVADSQGKYIGCLSATDYKLPKLIQVKSATLSVDTACNQGIWIADYRNDEGLRIRKDNISPCMTSSMRDSQEWNPKAGTRNPPLIGFDYKIRRLTPRECFRLMDFPDSFDFSCVSDSQAYKQAGNSIVVRVLEKIIKNLSL